MGPLGPPGTLTPLRMALRTTLRTTPTRRGETPSGGGVGTGGAVLAASTLRGPGVRAKGPASALAAPIAAAPIPAATIPEARGAELPAIWSGDQYGSDQALLRANESFVVVAVLVHESDGVTWWRIIQADSLCARDPVTAVEALEAAITRSLSVPGER